MIETAISWTLPESAGYRRSPVRPTRLRPAGFEDLFDASTIFYDCFRVSATTVMLLGPPLVRFPGVLDSLKITAIPEGSECAYRADHKFTRAFGNRKTHNLCRVLVSVPVNVGAIHLQCTAGDTTLPIVPASPEKFRGKRVLFTLSRNNDPVWICDWMRFHRDFQNADAVLLYDNGSTAYSVPALLEAINQVSGFATVTVVEWPYKYGPQGIGRGTWDSAFCQDGALEDARWRFLAEAYAVLNCDIDELTLSPEGNIFDQAAASPGGYLKFAGRWVSPPIQSGNRHSSGAPGGLPRHRESTHQLLPRWQWKEWMLRDVNLSPPKWAAVPARCPKDALWSVHEIVGMKARRKNMAVAGYRHFQNISTHWKKTRPSIERSKVEALTSDMTLQDAFSKVRWLE